MISTEVTIINKLGLHARAAAKLVETAGSFGSSIKIGRGEKLADCKSIMSVMLLAAGQGTSLLLEVSGEDEEAAAQAVRELIERRFDEPE